MVGEKRWRKGRERTTFSSFGDVMEFTYMFFLLFFFFFYFLLSSRATRAANIFLTKCMWGKDEYVRGWLIIYIIVTLNLFF